jgi:hypothetical protein
MGGLRMITSQGVSAEMVRLADLLAAAGRPTISEAIRQHTGMGSSYRPPGADLEHQLPAPDTFPSSGP